MTLSEKFSSEDVYFEDSETESDYSGVCSDVDERSPIGEEYSSWVEMVVQTSLLDWKEETINATLVYLVQKDGATLKEALTGDISIITWNLDELHLADRRIAMHSY